jgi:2-oxoglutarate/2-oxoacid ferredoxin oxidoreductase subunit alpha
VITKTFATGDEDVLLVAFGGTTGASQAAALKLRKKGVKAGVLHLITLWPFADREVARLGSRAKTVVVTKMNYSGPVAGEVQKVLGSGADIRKVNPSGSKPAVAENTDKCIGCLRCLYLCPDFAITIQDRAGA